MPSDARALLERLAPVFELAMAYKGYPEGPLSEPYARTLLLEMRALLAQPAPEPDAAFREAVTDLILQATKSEWGDSPALMAAESRVLALYAERAAPQGEECPVTALRAGDFAIMVAILPSTYPEGDRVRVSRVEVGMYDPKNDPTTGGSV